MTRPETENVTEEGWHKHLELIQGVVTRLAQNSYLLKTWTITLVAATFFLSISATSAWLVAIALIPTVAFSILDAYYLRQERLFRKLYNDVQQHPDHIDPFSMDIRPYEQDVDGVGKIMTSVSIKYFYPPIAVVILVAILARFFGGG